MLGGTVMWRKSGGSPDRDPVQTIVARKRAGECRIEAFHNSCGGAHRRPGSRARKRRMTQRTRAGTGSPEGYLFGSYRIATAPERNSMTLTSFRSTCFDSPSNSVGP
jgi:hypothetical protein